MKICGYLTVIVYSLSTQSLIACPTYLGRIQKDAPPIFSPEYDKKFWPEQALTQDNKQQEKEASSTHKIISMASGAKS